MDTRIMRLLVFFDLPMTTPRTKSAYRKFLNFLLADGYTRMQFSVYSRIAVDHEHLQQHMIRLQQNLPERGSIRCLRVTEKQFASIDLLLGPLSKQEEVVTATQLLLL